MSADVSHVSASVLERAALWHAELSSGENAEATRQACRRWRDAQPEHEAAFRRMAEVWNHFDALTGAEARPALALVEQELGHLRRGRGKPSAAAGMLGLLAVCGVALAVTQPLPVSWRADHATRIGEVREMQLGDGSRLVLNARSAVNIEFDANTRRVVLLRGEVLAVVGKDAQGRPFVVDTPEGSATALGTRYTVRLDEADGAMDVAVQESTVRVCNREAAQQRSCAEAVAGQRIHVHDGELSGPLAEDAGTMAAWTRQRLAVDTMELADVLARLRDYRGGWLRFDAQALAGLKVSGVFPLDDTDLALDMLAAHLPVRVVRGIPWVTTVERVE